jgi:hypothetical protein
MKKNITSKIVFNLIVGSLLFFNSLIGQSPYAHYNHWVTNGGVNAVAEDAAYVYVGGNFTHVGPPTGNGAKMTTLSTDPVLTYCRPNGSIYSVVSDGSGGWYIGGNFTSITTSSTTTVLRNRIAHILSNGQLDLAWNPNSSGVLWQFPEVVCMLQEILQTLVV